MEEYEKETKKERFWSVVLNVLIAVIIFIYLLANDFDLTKHVFFDLLRILVFLFVCFIIYKLSKYVKHKLFNKRK